jgi:hypothetical protein
MQFHNLVVNHRTVMRMIRSAANRQGKQSDRSDAHESIKCDVRCFIYSSTRKLKLDAQQSRISKKMVRSNTVSAKFI